MQYITHRRFKDTAICGPVNIPAQTLVRMVNGLIIWEDKPICAVDSQNGHMFFARNDDGFGMERGRLTQAIMNSLAKNDDQHQARWDKIWADETCQRYKREGYDDYWLWGSKFFSAPIFELKHIAALIGAEGCD